MKPILVLLILFGSGVSGFAQYVYTIKADSVLITSCDSAELIIENHTQAVPGFLFNTGRGRTVFKRAVQKLNDSLYLIGADTLKVLPANAVLRPNTGWTTTGNAGTVDGTNFLGTTNAVPLSFRVNNIPAGRIDTEGVTLFGYRAGGVNTGTNVAAFGTGALQANNGFFNTAMGASALQVNNDGFFNTAVGARSLVANTSGYSNTAVGSNALTSNTAGFGNTAMGDGVMTFNATGNNNTGIGNSALAMNTTASQNTALGASALTENTTGSNNTAFGTSAGTHNTSGSNNIYIGYNSGLGLVTGNNNTIIGTNVSGLPSSLSNNIILADGSGNKRLQFDGAGNLNVALQTSVTDTAAYKPLVQDASGNIRKSLSWPGAAAGGGTSTLQQTLTAGGTLTSDNTITNWDHTLLFDGGTYKFSWLPGVPIVFPPYTTTALMWQPDSSLATFTLSSGIYTPTITPKANVTDITVNNLVYNIIGSVVTVAGNVLIKPTAASTKTIIEISLPFGTSFQTGALCGGSASCQFSNAINTGYITGNPATDQVQIIFFAAEAGDFHPVSFSFSYNLWANF